jgi:phage gp16-like protein
MEVAADIAAEVRSLERVAACLPRRQAKYREAATRLAEHRSPTVVELRRAVYQAEAAVEACQKAAERAAKLRARHPAAFARGN